MEPFEVYKLYLALKLHFTTDAYDISEYKGAVRAKKETFLKRKDLTSIRKLARDYDRDEVVNLLVANFVSGDRWGGLFDESCVFNYKNYLTKHKKLLYNLNADLDLILFRMEKDGLESALSDEGHPLIFRMYMAGDISLESIVMIEKLYPFIEQYKNDFVLEDICRLVKKYKPFVKFDKDDIKLRYSGKLQKCLKL